MRIKKFKNFINESSVYDLETINPYDLFASKYEIDAFFDILKTELGASIRQTTTHGYQVTIPIEHISVLKMWKDKHGFEYETDRVTNREHPDYGKEYIHFNVFRDPTKFKNVDKYFKKLNQ